MFITTSGQFMTVKKTATGFIVSYPGQSSVADNTEKARYARLGFAGIAIGNSTFNGYCAFDLACPVEGNMKTVVELKADGFGKAVCPKCGSVYNLNNGGVPEEGVSEERLKPYAVSHVGDNLSISN